MANEKRLIDLDLAIAKVKDDGLLGTGYSDSERIDDVCDMLESCLTVDAVEVVRCKDCKYFHPGDKVYIPHCRHSSGFMNGHYNRETAFCSYGERKEGGNG